jgi:hypothetical protein
MLRLPLPILILSPTLYTLVNDSVIKRANLTGLHDPGSVGIAIGCGLDGRGSIHGRDKRFFSVHSVQTGPGVDPASYQVGTRG